VSGSQTVLDVAIEGERFNIHDVQPLPNELLLVCSRSYYKGPDDFEKNGRIYTRDGEFLREILLGDGIQTVQAMSSGVIWTSYFDEGVFGNYGWTDPVGASGLVAWDSDGNRVYDFQTRDGLDSICDCYALNVESEEDVWFYYYTEFPLIRLRRREIQSIWKMPVGGSDAFAVSAGHVLFRGGYKNRDTYLLFSLGSGGKPELLAKIELRDTNGGILVASRAVGRADAIHLVSDGFLYRVDVQSALAESRSG
jgi:outer membrane protein assembly factor BamB